MMFNWSRVSGALQVLGREAKALRQRQAFKRSSRQLDTPRRGKEIKEIRSNIYLFMYICILILYLYVF